MTTLRFTSIAHRAHDIMSPLAPAHADMLLSALAAEEDHRVLDIGCGNGTMLVRIAERAGPSGVEGCGIDRNPLMIERAQARAARLPRAAVSRLRWRVADAGASIGSDPELSAPFQRVLCVGAAGALGGYAQLVRTLPSILAPDGRALIGEGYWRRDPDDGYLAALGASRGEMGSFESTLRAAEASGFRVECVHQSSPEEWDEYEDRYARAIEEWCSEHLHDVDAPAFAARVRAWRSAYQQWGRNTLGFMSMVLSPERS